MNRTSVERRTLSTALAICWAAFAAAMASGSALGQSAAELAESLQSCAAIENNEERVACYDRLSNAEAGKAANEDSTITGTAAPEPPPSELPEPVGALEPDATTTVDIEASRGGDVNDAGGVMTVLVTEVHTNELGGTSIVTDDGRVWRRVSRARARFPEVPFPAQLEGGSFGSYFLASPNREFRVRVALRD